MNTLLVTYHGACPVKPNQAGAVLGSKTRDELQTTDGFIKETKLAVNQNTNTRNKGSFWFEPGPSLSLPMCSVSLLLCCFSDKG